MRDGNPRSIVLNIMGALFLGVAFGFLLYLGQPLRTLLSLEQVDDYPLYVMHYYGDPEEMLGKSRRIGQLFNLEEEARTDDRPVWACSLFAALGDESSRLYGRNFDWGYSPAVLLFHHPQEGYDSVTMVDIDYLLGVEKGARMMELSLVEKAALLSAPLLPFDGMNEEGLAIGMAMVPNSRAPHDPEKESLGSLALMREVLDHAATVDEAIVIFERYNVLWDGGPPVHYLVADPHGDAVLVEYDQEELVFLPPEAPAWHAATNFMRHQVEGPRTRCWRYGKLHERLTESEGQLEPEAGLTLLGEVAQDTTQWSVVYDLSARQIHVVMGRDYDSVHTFDLE